MALARGSSLFWPLAPRLCAGVASGSGEVALSLNGLTSLDEGLSGERGRFMPLSDSTNFHLVDEADMLLGVAWRRPPLIDTPDIGVCWAANLEGCCWEWGVDIADGL